MLGFVDKFQTYSGERPPTKGIYFNEEKQQLEDWTHTALKAEEPDPIKISVKDLGNAPDLAFQKWINEFRD